MYRIKSLAIMAGLIGLFSLVGYSLFGWTGALLVLGSGVVVNGLALGSAPRLILGFHRARVIAPQEAPGLYRIAGSLARRAGVPLPILAVYPSDLPNAFALGTGDRGTLAVSTGLLDLLSSREIAGVLAHEFAHLKNQDSLLSLSAGLFVQAIGTLSNAFGLFVLVLFLSGAWAAAGPGLLPAVLLVGVAPYLAYALQAALMRTRERLADRDGALLSGDPGGLASALHKLEYYNRYLAGIYRRFRFIYTTETETGPGWLRTHPSTQERVRSLLDLEGKLTPYPAQAVPGYIAVL